MAEDRQPDPADQPDDPSEDQPAPVSRPPTILGGSSGSVPTGRRVELAALRIGRASRPTRSRPCCPRSAAAT